MPDDQTRQAAATALGPMRPGEILGTAFRLYRRHWRTLLAIVAVAVPLAVSFPSTKVLPGPGGEYQVIVYHRAVATGGSWADTAIVVVVMVAAALVFAVVAGAVTRAAVAAVAGEDLGVRRSYRFGIGRLWPLLLVILMTWLLTMLGLVLFVVPGVVVGVLLAVSIPAQVVEGRRARDALLRSWSLVGGQWWHTFFTLLLTWLLLGVAANLVINAVGGLGWLAQTVAQGLAIVLVTPFAALVAVLLYLDLRARAEPLDSNLLRRDLEASGA
ncbi:MAG TPA: hypothetical protein VHO93_09030 [Actinomycetota bacterium]|nr:hypothetical protein [Actinomycetota bacterium]